MLIPSSGSTFVDILKSEVLDDHNYIDWKQRVDILLGFYGYKDVIFDE